jgi:hypothetical protein
VDTLLLCKEDLGMDLPEQWTEGLKRVVIWSPASSEWEPGWKPSSNVLAYDEKAVEDAAIRWGEVTDVAQISGAELDQWWKRTSEDRVAMPWLPVGMIRDQLERRWRASGRRPQVWLREWDQKLWPYAKAGFFPFWKKVNAFLTRDSIDIPA